MVTNVPSQEGSYGPWHTFILLSRVCKGGARINLFSSRFPCQPFLTHHSSSLITKWPINNEGQRLDNISWPESSWDIYKQLVAASFMSEIFILTRGPEVNLCPLLPWYPSETGAVIEHYFPWNNFQFNENDRKRMWRNQAASCVLHVITLWLSKGRLRWIFYSL